MTDLHLLCADVKNERSPIKLRTDRIIAEIYLFLRCSSDKTREAYACWKEDFKYIYGDADSNLSSNSKLDRQKLFRTYGISCGDCNTEALLALFFSVQTFFSLFTKYIMKEVLDAGEVPYADIILGDFAKRRGIVNYCSEDVYCWPVFELDNGFVNIIEDIASCVKEYSSDVSVSDFLSEHNCDFIKQIYEAIIPKELRHALGEFYTPEWLAELTIKNAVEASEKDIRDITLTDPTCGSGTFLLKAIRMKRERGCRLGDILHSVRGIDVNPLAVLTAKTNYLLSVLDMMDGREIEIPVYNADIISFADMDIREKADVIIGNPPWISWEYMPEKYRKDSHRLWTEYSLVAAKGRAIRFYKEDISVLITYIVMDKLLRDGGVLGFVIKQALFKSVQNGAGFRRFTVKEDTPVRVMKVYDLSKIKAFENAANGTAVFIAKKGERNVYPVPYCLWEKNDGIKKCILGAYSCLDDVMRLISVKEQRAVPSDPDDAVSPWITAENVDIASMRKILGKNSYRARTGVFTGGANAVYWLKINSDLGKTVFAENIVERAKRKTVCVEAELEKEHIYPMLKGGNVKKWSISYDTYLLCPHTKDTKMMPVSHETLAHEAPKTLGYLYSFREMLDGRNGFAGWEKDIQRKEFHAILRIGGYTFSKYKVVWKYIANEFICAVAGTVNDAYLGEKLILPNEKVMYVSTDSEAEAYYLCGILSSRAVADCVKSYMNPMSISAHVLGKLNIPDFDSENPLHMKVSEICKSGHGKADISSYIAEIDALIPKIYEI